MTGRKDSIAQKLLMGSACSLTLGFGAISSAQPNPSNGEPICQTLPDESMPVLRWCESENVFRYEILTWNEEIILDKRQTLQEAQQSLSTFLTEECRSKRLQFEKASFGIWLHIPFYGAETATPRLALKLESPGSSQNLLFAQGPWQSGWNVSHDNMAIMGSYSYADFDGYAYFGFKPEKSLILELSQNIGPDIPKDLAVMLKNWGVIQTERHHPKKPRYVAWTKIYDEETTLQKILESGDVKKNFSYVEANAYWEGAGNHILLYQEKEPLVNCAK